MPKINKMRDALAGMLTEGKLKASKALPKTKIRVAKAPKIK